MESNPIKKVSTVGLVCERIQNCIKRGDWQIGERLPAESDLAASFGVNRLTVRMALQKLNTLGIVETRTGSGTYVMLFDLSNHIQEVSDLYMEPRLLDSVCEFRRIVEVECAELAIQRRTANELERLFGLLSTYDQVLMDYTKDASNENWKRCAKADLAFHKLIVQMAHNKLLEYAFSVAEQSIYQFIKVMNQRRTQEQRRFAIPSQFNDVHREIYEAIRDQNLQKCRDAYLLMISQAEQV